MRSARAEMQLHSFEYFKLRSHTCVVHTHTHMCSVCVCVRVYLMSEITRCAILYVYTTYVHEAVRWGREKGEVTAPKLTLPPRGKTSKVQNVWGPGDFGSWLQQGLGSVFGQSDGGERRERGRGGEGQGGGEQRAHSVVYNSLTASQRKLYYIIGFGLVWEGEGGREGESEGYATRIMKWYE